MTEQHQHLVDAHPDVSRTALQAEIARLLDAGIPLSLAVNTLIASILVAVQHSVLNIGPILAWCALLGATLALRAVFTVTYRRTQKDELASETWLTRFRIGAATTGIAWGLASFLLFPANDITYQSFLILAIAGMTAGAVTSLSVDLASSLAFIIPALVPLIARLLAEGGEVPLAMGAMGTLYLVALILNARRASINIRENICLRFEAITHERDMRESEERFRLIMGTMEEVFWMADVPIARMLYISPAYERVWGRTIQSLHENPPSFIEAIHPEDVQRVLSNLEAEKMGQPFDHEYRIVRPDGTIRWIWDRGFPVRDETGKVTRYAGIAQDITGRKRMEQEILRANTELEERVKERTKELEKQITARKNIENELMQVKERYDFATMIGKVGTWDWNPVTGVLYWSDETFRLMGFTPGSVIPSYELYLDLVHPDDRELLNSSVQAALHEKKPYDLDCRVILGSGKMLACHVTGKVEFDANGQPARMLGTIQDITERKNIEIILRENEAKLRAYMSNISDIIVLVSASLNIIYVSPSVTHLLGLLPEDMTGQQAGFFIHPDDMGVIANAMSYVIEHSGEPHTIQHRIRHKDGRWIHVETTGVNMMGNPAINGVLAVMRDITERKKAEEQLRIAAATFETHEAILITDADANIIRVNRAFTEITGYSQEEVLGKNPRILSSGRQDKAFYAAMWQQLLHTGSWTGEMWDKRKNGQIYPKWLTITAVKDTAGKTTQYVASFNDITERKKTEEEIRNLAFYDVLTKLPNRRLFLDRFGTALIASARHNNFGAVLFIDLDRFKMLNDTLGHDYGDLLLIEVASRIKTCVREMDTVARLGGDEFSVLIEDISTDQSEASYKAGQVAEKIRESLAHPYNLNGHEYHCSPSIGVSLYHGNEEAVGELLRHADLAMYQAKDSGRNTVRFFDPIMQNNVAARAALVNDLRSAIAHRQLQLYYQLQVDKDNRPAGAEALLRWVHPQRGIVTPEQFLPVAEESTLILDIGDWVLETACRQLALWSANEKMRDLVLTINICAKQFAMPDFADKVAHALQTHQINPSHLKLELTESMALDNLPSATAKMHALKALGISLSMDDFGSRYSSLSNLKYLPLDQIKLGRGFVKDIAYDGNVALLVQSIIDLSSKYRITVIAEGVENETQLALLKDHDCVAYQGFLFSNALSIEEFEQLLS